VIAGEDFIMTDRDRLSRLLRAGYPCVSIVTQEESYALEVVRDVAFEMGSNATGSAMWLWSVVGGVRDGLIEDALMARSTEHPAAALYHFSQFQSGSLCVMLDLVPHLGDQKTLRLLRDVIAWFGKIGGQLILIDSGGEMPESIASYATRFELSLPGEEELEQIIRDTLRRQNRERAIDVEISRSQLQTIVRNLRGLTRRQAARIVVECVAEDRRFDADDVNTVLAGKRRALQGTGLLEFMETPVSLDEVGGLKRLKHWLAHRQQAVTDEGAAFGLSAPRGLLLLGVQGAGKSLCAKAIATAWQRPLLRMDVGALYDRYVGESERRLREAFRQAEAMAPIVLWVDEIEKAFASAASRNIDGGLSQRMFGALLTWMQERSAPVFLVATANDIEALPPELLRKGRFDEIFFVDLPSAATREQIFRIHLCKRKRDPAKVDLGTLVELADGFSGAEIEQAIVAALHEAFAAKSDLTTDLIARALRESPPLSVTMAEKVAELRAWAKNRCVPAD